MDHHQQHHEHHRKEREEKKKEQKLYEAAHAKDRLPIHPAWLWGTGFAFVLCAVLIWTFLLR